MTSAMKRSVIDGVIDAIAVDLVVAVGDVDMSLGAVLALQRGTIIPLGRSATDPLIVRANGIDVATARVQLKGEQVTAVIERAT